MISLSFSCTKNVKQEAEKFERQVSSISLDEILLGDNVSYWGNDIPQAGIFILNSKASYLAGFALIPLKFNEDDQPQEYLYKTINTKAIYQLEVYQLNKNLDFRNDKVQKIDYKNPKICEYISNNFNRADLIYKAQNVSFRVKEREWVWINKKVDPEALVFIRLGIADPFMIINNKSIDGLYINAKRIFKPWEEYLPNDKKQIISWGCQESMYIDSRVIEGTFYNPDIVFNYY